MVIRSAGGWSPGCTDNQSHHGWRNKSSPDRCPRRATAWAFASSRAPACTRAGCPSSELRRLGHQCCSGEQTAGYVRDVCGLRANERREARLLERGPRETEAGGIRGSVEQWTSGVVSRTGQECRDAGACGSPRPEPGSRPGRTNPHSFELTP
jgi:hypothetical protein